MLQTMKWALALVLCVGLAGGLLAGPKKPRIEKPDDYNPVINPADFEDGGGQPLPIDNMYLPMVPGTTFVYEAETEDGLEHNEVAVTHDTKVILGVTCVVVSDNAWVEGVLEEETLDWFAQDRWGNVWYFGEDTKAYDDGAISTEGSWEAGVDGAKPGIVMLADPVSGASYWQEFLEEVAEDMAKVLRLNASVSGIDDWSPCIETKEWSPLEKGVVEHKFYAPGVGLVLVKELKGGTIVVELVEIIVE